MYFRLSIQGTQGSFEVWSINPVYDPSVEVQGWDQTVAQQMVAAAVGVTIPPLITSMWNPTTKATKMRLEGRSDADDTLMGYVEAAYPAPRPGTNVNIVLPLTSAVVVTLMTLTSGPRGRGRLYLPATGAQLIGPDGRLNAPTPDELAGAAKTWLAGIGDAMKAVLQASQPLTNLSLAVRSKTAKATPHVTSLRVGDVIDTQRRRRDNLPETYATVSYSLV